MVSSKMGGAGRHRRSLHIVPITLYNLAELAHDSLGVRPSSMVAREVEVTHSPTMARTCKVELPHSRASARDGAAE
jgi:hypothetical protein